MPRGRPTSEAKKAREEAKLKTEKEELERQEAHICLEVLSWLEGIFPDRIKFTDKHILVRAFVTSSERKRNRGN